MKKWLILCFIIFLLSGCTANNNLNKSQSQNQHQLKKEAVTLEGEKNETRLKKNINQSNHQANVQKDETTMKEKAMLDVPLVPQNPELKYGCEVTSLTMVLQYAGVDVDKIKLANELQKDQDPIQKNNGDITHWGDPDEGFVGDITGQNAGYAVFDKPLEQLMAKYLPDRTVNLTGRPFPELLKQVSEGKPVVVWTTGDYKLPDRWELWQHEDEIIKTPLDLHAVVLVGYDQQYVYLNDPLSEKKSIKVNKDTFIESWKALKMRAISYY